MALLRKLSLREIADLVRVHIKSLNWYTALSADERQKLTLGLSVDTNFGSCTVYIPGERHEDGRLLANFEIERATGNIRESS